MAKHALLLLLAFGPIGHAAGASEPEPTFAFVLRDENRQLGSRAGRVAQQVVDTFRETGIRATWSSDASDPLLDPTRTVAVVVLSQSSRDWHIGSGVVGAVSPKLDPGSVFIFYPDIERALGLRGPREPTILGGGWPILCWQRAIARVIAHEILHYFLPGRPHDTTGLFARDLSGSRLVRPRLELTEDTKNAFTAALGRAAGTR